MTLDVDELRRLRALAELTAEEAGDLLLSLAPGDLAVRTKTSSSDPVSEADDASERLIVDRLLEARPDDGILGEEEADNRVGTSGFRWVIDPLDGTVNYLYGIPQWCVSIALEDPDGTPVVGVVHDPNRRETFGAFVGGGASVNEASVREHELRVSQPRSLDTTLLTTGFAYDPDVRAAQADFFAGILGRVRDARRFGAAALDLAWVAAGRIDVYLENSLQRWDWAAGRLLVTEAGGVAHDLELDLGLAAPVDGLIAGGPAAVRSLLDELNHHVTVLA
ncbi:MAG: inositol monophosphatase family protein [Nitriliruptorales bacterium]|nr:inositol monophosphatase family protein [Nitriliruptorales bacterium]